MSRAFAVMALVLGTAAGSARAQDAAEGEACGEFHVGGFSWAVECEPDLRCEIDRTEPWGELGVCGAETDEACSLDKDCEPGTWCRDTEDQNRKCVPFVGAGERCEGFTLPWFFERCEPSLQCVLSEPTGDVPGICASCEHDGKPVQAGETFPADDGCNTCTCTADGLIACTKRACPQRCGGLLGLQCDRLEFCDYPAAAMCGAADQMGVCRAIPDACTAEFDPVCGCDDRTYSNACVANAKGVSVAKNGSCDSADICQLPAAPGPCLAHLPRFYFNADSGQCEPFTYGGCRANENNFGSLEECQQACHPPATTCKVGGCSGQLCVGPGEPDISTCEWRPEYACYRSATCEIQASGKCGWTRTDELLECLHDAH